MRELTGGRGPDSVIDAVGMEAHGAPVGKLAQTLAGLIPDPIARKVMENGGIDRLSALRAAIEIVRRGGTVSLSGVYGGTADPLNMLQMFDKQITLRMGQANVRRWIDDILPLLVGDDDPLGVDDLRHPPRAARRGARRPTRCSRRRTTARSRWCSAPSFKCRGGCSGRAPGGCAGSQPGTEGSESVAVRASGGDPAGRGAYAEIRFTPASRPAFWSQDDHQAGQLTATDPEPGGAQRAHPPSMMLFARCAPRHPPRIPTGTTCSNYT